MEDSNLSPEDMRNWLRQELRDIARSTELRVHDATDFVTAYAAGKLSEQEMKDRLSIYHYRWGDEPIPGFQTTENMTNNQVIEGIDNALPKTVQETVRRKLARTQGVQRKR